MATRAQQGVPDDERVRSGQVDEAVGECARNRCDGDAHARRALIVRYAAPSPAQADFAAAPESAVAAGRQSCGAAPDHRAAVDDGGEDLARGARVRRLKQVDVGFVGEELGALEERGRLVREEALGAGTGDGDDAGETDLLHLAP